MSQDIVTYGFALLDSDNGGSVSNSVSGVSLQTS